MVSALVSSYHRHCSALARFCLPEEAGSVFVVLVVDYRGVVQWWDTS